MTDDEERKERKAYKESLRFRHVFFGDSFDPELDEDRLVGKRIKIFRKWSPISPDEWIDGIEFAKELGKGHTEVTTKTSFRALRELAYGGNFVVCRRVPPEEGGHWLYRLFVTPHPDLNYEVYDAAHAGHMHPDRGDKDVPPSPNYEMKVRLRKHSTNLTLDQQRIVIRLAFNRQRQMMLAFLKKREEPDSLEECTEIYKAIHIHNRNPSGWIRLASAAGDLL